MVVVMVFITVTVVSRASVTPTTSDAATVKKKDNSVGTVATKTTNSLPTKYTYQKLDFGNSEENLIFSTDMNDSGYIIGEKNIWLGGYSYEPQPTLWDPKGNGRQLIDSHFTIRTYLNKINNSNVIIGDAVNFLTYEDKGFKFTVEKGYQELPGIPQEKKFKLGNIISLPLKGKFNITDYWKKTNTKYSNLSNDRRNDFYIDSTIPLAINNDSDVVGESNRRGLLWINEKKGFIDLSTLIAAHYPNPERVVPLVISNRVNGDVKISGVIQTYNGNDVKSVLFIMDYSIANSKEISFKLIENIGGGRLPETWPSDILLDETIAAYYYYYDQYGFFKSDSYLISAKGDYENSEKISEKLTKAGINFYNSEVRSVNNNKIGVGAYSTSDDIWNYHCFVIDMNTGQVQVIDDMIKEGAIQGYIPNTTLYPYKINSAGEMVVSTYNNVYGKTFTGKLIPIK